MKPTFKEILIEMWDVFLMLIPRFVTSRVALAYAEDGTLQVLCFEGEEQPGDDLYIECYGTLRTFTWFNQYAGGWCHIDD